MSLDQDYCSASESSSCDKPHLDYDHASTSSLPTELLSKIFVHCVSPSPSLEDSMSSQKLPILGRCSSPLNISQVCRAWRTIALASPELWSYFSLKTPLLSLGTFHRLPGGLPHCGKSFNPENEEHLCSVTSCYERELFGFYQRLKVWLSRSGQHPLTFSLDLNGAKLQGEEISLIKDDDFGMTSYVGSWSILPALQDLAKHVMRWQNVFISGEFSCLLPNIPKSLKPGESRLEALVIGDSYTFEEIRLPSSIRRVHILQHAKLTLNPTHLTNLYNLEEFVLNHTSSSTEKFEPEHVIQIIGMCPRLERLKIPLVSVDTQPPRSSSLPVPISTRVVSHTLKYLVLSGSPSPLIKIIDGIALPSASRSDILVNRFCFPGGETDNLIEASLDAMFLASRPNALQVL